MAVDKDKDLYVIPYVRQGRPDFETSDKEYLDVELSKLETTLTDVTDAALQITDVAPDAPRRGMMRYAIDPWDPGEGFNEWYMWDGTAWVLAWDSANTSIGTNTSSIATLNARFSITVDANEYVDGISQNDGTNVSVFRVTEAAFKVVDSAGGASQPGKAAFLVDTGVVYLDTAMLKDASVAGAKIAALGIDTAQLAADAVETAKILDGNVTTAKLAANAVNDFQQYVNRTAGDHGSDFTLNTNATTYDESEYVSTTFTVDDASLDVHISGYTVLGWNDLTNSHTTHALTMGFEMDVAGATVISHTAGEANWANSTKRNRIDEKYFMIPFSYIYNPPSTGSKTVKLRARYRQTIASASDVTLRAAWEDSVINWHVMKDN